MEPHVLCDKDRCANMHACMHACMHGDGWADAFVAKSPHRRPRDTVREKRHTVRDLQGQDCHAGLPCRRCKDPTRPNTEVRPHLCTRTHAGTCTHTHARTHARIHTHTHNCFTTAGVQGRGAGYDLGAVDGEEPIYAGLSLLHDPLQHIHHRRLRLLMKSLRLMRQPPPLPRRGWGNRAGGKRGVNPQQCVGGLSITATQRRKWCTGQQSRGKTRAGEATLDGALELTAAVTASLTC